MRTIKTILQRFPVSARRREQASPVVESRVAARPLAWKAILSRALCLAVISTIPAQASDVLSTAKRVPDAKQTELIVISREGIFPAVLRVKPGPLRLQIRNHLGVALPALEIDTLSKQRMQSLGRRTGFKSHDQDALDLPAGNYVLRVAGLPGIECKLVVDAQQDTRNAQ